MSDITVDISVHDDEDVEIEIDPDAGLVNDAFGIRFSCGVLLLVSYEQLEALHKQITPYFDQSNN